MSSAVCAAAALTAAAPGKGFFSRFLSLSSLLFGAFSVCLFQSVSSKNLGLSLCHAYNPSRGRHERRRPSSNKVNCICVLCVAFSATTTREHGPCRCTAGLSFSPLLPCPSNLEGRVMSPCDLSFNLPKSAASLQSEQSHKRRPHLSGLNLRQVLARRRGLSAPPVKGPHKTVEFRPHVCICLLNWV